MAELGPPGPAAPETVESYERALEELARSGELTPARAIKGDWAWRPRGAGLPPESVDRLLEELRSDRPVSDG